MQHFSIYIILVLVSFGFGFVIRHVWPRISNRFMKNDRYKRRGQTIIDYILLVTVVLVVFLAFIAPGGVFQTKYNYALSKTLDTATNVIKDILNGEFDL